MMAASQEAHLSDMTRPATEPPDRFLFAIVLGALALIALGIAAVLVTARAPAPPPPDPTSPVGVVTAYIGTLRAGDAERARSFLSQSAREALDRTRDQFPRYVDSPTSDRRVLIEPVEITAPADGPERAIVKVTISTFSARSEPFSANTYHHEVEVRLVKENGQWRIAQPIDPYQLLY